MHSKLSMIFANIIFAIAEIRYLRMTKDFLNSFQAEVLLFSMIPLLPAFSSRRNPFALCIPEILVLYFFNGI